MSRSGYSDDYDEDGTGGLWRGAVTRSIKGKRGQAFLRELAAALDAMPIKRLTTGELESDGEFCALGVVGHARSKNLGKIDTEDWAQLSREFGIAEAMAREIMYHNDEGTNDYKWIDVTICGPVRPYRPEWGKHTRSISVPDTSASERRWADMRKWVESQIAPVSASGGPGHG